jgi:hypothetical protein
MVPAATSTAPATGVLPVRVDLPTTFLPLSTAWPNNPKCSSYIYQGLYSSLIAFDPIYGRDIDSAAADCLPPEAISWWWWKDEDPAAVTSLGYDFTCPEAYYTATKIGADAMRTQIFCCPL